MERQQTQPPAETILSPDALGGFLIEPLVADNEGRRLLGELSEATNISDETVFSALQHALFVHKDERRKSGESYQNHVLRVALIVARDLGLHDNTELIVASLLHDSVENHAIKLAKYCAGELCTDEGQARKACFDYLQKVFGDEVMQIIQRVTNPIKTTDPIDSDTKIDSYVRHIKEVVMPDLPATILKVADTLDNIREEPSLDTVIRNRLDEKYICVLPLYIQALEVRGDPGSRANERLLAALNEAKFVVESRLGACATTLADLLGAADGKNDADELVPRVA